jgi:hypothetical protein
MRVFNGLSNTGYDLLVFLGTSNGYAVLNSGDGVTNAWNNNNPIISPNVIALNNWTMTAGVVSNTTIQPYTNGSVSTLQSGTLTAGSLTGLNIGGGYGTLTNASAQGWNGYIGEIIMYNGALNTTQRQSVERYLSLKWGLSNFYTSIPGSIPGLTLWLDGADTTTMTFPSGSNVSGWKDKGSLGFTLSNLNSGIYPSFIPNLGVYFSNNSAVSNASCQAIVNSSVWYVPTQNATLLVSYKPTSTDSYRAPLIIGTTAGVASKPNFYLSPQCGASEADSILYDYTTGVNWSMNAYASINTYAGLRIDTLVSTPGATSGFIFFNGTETTYSSTIAPYTSTYTNYPATVQVGLGSMFGSRAFSSP